MHVNNHQRPTGRLRRAAQVVAFFGLAQFGSTSVLAVPPMSWTPTKLTTDIVAGQTREVQVELHVGENAKGLSLRVNPGVKKLVSVVSDFPSTATAGTTIPVTLVIEAGANVEEGFENGVIQVRSGKRVLAKPLPILLSVIVNPLRDIDADSDGIWDDYQTFVDGSYHDRPAVQQAARQLGAALQTALLVSGDQSQSIAAAAPIQRSIECLWAIEGSGAIGLRKEMMLNFLNSDARVRAYALFDQQLGGQVYPVRSMKELDQSCQ